MMTHSSKFTVFLFFLTLLGNAGAWLLLNPSAMPENWQGLIKGLAYTPHQAIKSYDELSAHPDITVEQIERDFKVFDGQTQNVRIYSATHGQENIPKIAQQHGMQVMAGAWLNNDAKKNAEEVNAVIGLANQYPNINRVLLGNEVLFREELTVDQAIEYLDKANPHIKQPISIAEPWHIWERNPKLVQHVDFIAVHIFPYWESKSIDNAIAEMLQHYQTLQTQFPNKEIVIAEAGWPSKGKSYGDADASLINEARFLREFFNLAEQQNIDYYVMEAFDQPWKHSTENSTGEHWGIFDDHGRLKFPLTGKVYNNPWWLYELLTALVLSLIPSFIFFKHGQSVGLGGKLAYFVLVQGFSSLLSYSLFAPIIKGLDAFNISMWALLLPVQLVLLLVVLINGFEFVELLWKKRQREFIPSEPAPLTDYPKVSLHLAICNEPPDLVIETLNSLARLNYPNYEVLVIDNNTNDEALWQPVQAHCQTLGEHFRFFTLGKWQGFKAGALNFALQQTAQDADIIGVVDSDYLVETNWLATLVPYFQEAKVGFVQAPQDHRDWQHDHFQEVCNWEYAGFFHIGMVHRNESDAIIQHGTMTLIRKAALQQVGNWAEWCICEDAELGLKLMKNGYSSVYVNHAFGKGLTPQTFIGFKKQRFRWVYGATQILRQHWQDLTKPHSVLSNRQRYHFLSGWFPWFADALSLLSTLGAVFWSVALIALPDYSRFPLDMFLITAFSLFIFKIIYGLLLYKALVPCTLKQRIGAAIAGMSLTHTIALGVIQGFITKNQPFFRTPKAEDKPALIQSLLMVREELMMLLGLIASIAGVIWRYDYQEADVIWWLVILSILSLPYISAFYMSLANVKPWRS